MALIKLKLRENECFKLYTICPRNYGKLINHMNMMFIIFPPILRGKKTSINPY